MLDLCILVTSSVIPIRLVPPQTPEGVTPLVKAHLEKAFAALKTKNKLTIENLGGGAPWVTDHTHWNFEAAKRATKVTEAGCLILAFC